MKKKSCKEKTIHALNGYFITAHNGKLVINTEYLNETIITMLNNDRHLRDAVKGMKRKTNAIVWEAFQKKASEIINYEYPEADTEYYATSAHLKAFLDQYGQGYDSIAESVRHVKETRAKIAKEQKKEENEQIY